MAVVQSIVPLLGSYTGRLRWMALARPMAFGQFAFITLSFLCLVNAFVTNDFSVAYVANNSNTLLPLHYKITAAWGGHEGSLLMWILVLAGWTQAVAMKSYRLPHELSARVLSVLGMVSVGFLLFTLLTSNPLHPDPAFPAGRR